MQQQHVVDEHAARTARQSKLLMRVVELAKRIGRRGMRSYAHDTSPKVFPRPRTFACL
jgi:hypothetical protein